MSQAYYTQRWQKANLDLNRIIGIEKPKVPKELTGDRATCFEEISTRYVKYSMIYKNMLECYDNMIQPQKRILMNNMLKELTGRIIELRCELERLTVGEYINLVNTCFDLKVPVDNIELSLSYAHHTEKMAKIHQRVVLLDYILHTMTAQQQTDEVPIEPFMCTITEAVLLIQKNQRAFVARLRAKEVKRLNELRKKLATRTSRVLMDHLGGIIKFQSLWRGHKLRSILPTIRNQNAVLVGMHMPPDMDLEKFEVLRKTLKAKNHTKALEYEEEFNASIEISTEAFYETKAEKMVDGMRRHIRQWILEYYDLMNSFPELPEEEDGGSLMIYANKTVEEVEEELDEMGDEKGKGKKEEKKKDKDKKDKDKKKGKKGAGEEGPFAMMPSKFVDEGIVPNVEQFNSIWLGRVEENTSQSQRYNRNLMMEDIYKKAEQVLRTRVDDLMRAELEELNLGIAKKKPGKPKKKKAKKGGKKGGKKGKKGKKGKDLTEGVPLEDLYKELVVSGIVKKVPPTNLKDFIGAVNLMCPTDSVGMEFKHDLGDVRKMVFDYAIFPMSSETVHTRVPLRKSLMIVGPHGSGKKMLVNAVCYELGANLFDLSPENIQHVYTDAEGQKRLMHLVMKVGKLMEPSIIHIENCDRMFTKKLPPEDNTKPARMKKELMKALKQITPEDRIMLIGTSRTPFGAAVKPLFKVYERLIFIYPPSSKSRYTLWQRFIEELNGVIPIHGFDLTPLSHVTSGFTAGTIKAATIEVLTGKRVLRQQVKPLAAIEFLNRLATFDPVFVEELEAAEKWLVKTPLRKKLAIVQELEAEGECVLPLL